MTRRQWDRYAVAEPSQKQCKTMIRENTTKKGGKKKLSAKEFEF